MIRNFWRKIVFEKQLKKRLHLKQIGVPFKVKKIAIIVDAFTGVESRFFLDLAKKFKIPEVQISLLLLKGDSKLDKQYQHIFNAEEVDFWGHFKGDLLSFCETEYDLLINYYNTQNVLNNLISVRINHKISVGFTGADSRINDLIFDFDPKDKHTFEIELIKYMHVLNKI